MQALLLALCSLVTVSPLAPTSQEVPVVKEKKSKVPFSRWGPAPGSDRIHTLVGTGLRTKTVFKAKVYAVGLYVDADQARETLSSWKGKSADQLAMDEDFYQAILRPELEMSLRLVLTRNIDGEDLRSAFEDALRPRVRSAAQRGLLGGEEALETFRNFFDEGKLGKKSELIFTRYADGRLFTLVNRVERPLIKNTALAWALFDVYLGVDPIQKQAKRSLVELFPDVLAGKVPPK